MQLVIKYGAVFNGTKCDLVVAHYLDDVDVPMGEFPGLVLIPYAGVLDALARIGEAPPHGTFDTRPYLAPPVDLHAYAASRRYAVETGGLTVAGVRVRTDRESQGLVTGAYVRAQGKAADAVISFKANGAWVKMPAAQVVVLGDAIGDHVQACFDAEEALDAAISAGTVTTMGQVDAAFAALGA